MALPVFCLTCQFSAALLAMDAPDREIQYRNIVDRAAELTEDVWELHNKSRHALYIESSNLRDTLVEAQNELDALMDEFTRSAFFFLAIDKGPIQVKQVLGFYEAAGYPSGWVYADSDQTIARTNTVLGYALLKRGSVEEARSIIRVIIHEEKLSDALLETFDVHTADQYEDILQKLKSILPIDTLITAFKGINYISNPIGVFMKRYNGNFMDMFLRVFTQKHIKELLATNPKTSPTIFDGLYENGGDAKLLYIIEFLETLKIDEAKSFMWKIFTYSDVNGNARYQTKFMLDIILKSSEADFNVADILDRILKLCDDKLVDTLITHVYQNDTALHRACNISVYNATGFNPDYDDNIEREMILVLAGNLSDDALRKGILSMTPTFYADSLTPVHVAALQPSQNAMDAIFEVLSERDPSLLDEVLDKQDDSSLKRTPLLTAVFHSEAVSEFMAKSPHVRREHFNVTDKSTGMTLRQLLDEQVEGGERLEVNAETIQIMYQRMTRAKGAATSARDYVKRM